MLPLTVTPHCAVSPDYSMPSPQIRLFLAHTEGFNIYIKCKKFKTGLGYVFFSARSLIVLFFNISDTSLKINIILNSILKNLFEGWGVV